MSRLRKKTQGWGARIRFGEKLGRDEWFALHLGHDQEPLAKDRLARLQAMAKRLAELGQHANARAYLEEAAETPSERGFRAIEKMVEEMVPEAERQQAPRTVRQVARELCDGTLHELYPEEVGYRSDENRERRRQQLSVFLPLLGDLTFDQVTRELLDEAKRLVPAGSAHNTRRRYLRELRALLRVAVEPLRLVESVPHLAVPAEARSDLFQLFYPDEDERLLGHEEVAFEERFLYGYLARKGTRITETLQYTWEACDLERGIMNVAAEWTKTKRARSYDLDPDVLEALRLRRRQIPDAYLVFVPPPGLSQLERCIVHQRLHPNLRAAGIDRRVLFEPPEGQRPFTTHDWRASCITLARALGVPDRTIMDRTGHETVQVFERYDRGMRHMKRQGFTWWAPMAWALGMKGAKVTPAGLGQSRAKATKAAAKSLRPTFLGGPYQAPSQPVNPQNHTSDLRSLALSGGLGPAQISTSGQSRDPLQHLRAAAHAALDQGNRPLLQQLLAVIEAEEQRASAQAPVQLEVVRARKESK